jgi:hypothetical protein
MSHLLQLGLLLMLLILVLQLIMNFLIWSFKQNNHAILDKYIVLKTPGFAVKGVVLAIELAAI